MSRRSIRLSGVALLLVAAALVILPMRTFLAVDSCLDAGGSFDYSKAQCDPQNSHPYERPALSGPLVLGIGALFALTGGVLVVFSRRVASEPGMRSNTSLERTREG